MPLPVTKIDIAQMITTVLLTMVKKKNVDILVLPPRNCLPVSAKACTARVEIHGAILWGAGAGKIGWTESGRLKYHVKLHI